jgi:hypothetical protein
MRSSARRVVLAVLSVFAVGSLVGCGSSPPPANEGPRATETVTVATPAASSSAAVPAAPTGSSTAAPASSRDDGSSCVEAKVAAGISREGDVAELDPYASRCLDDGAFLTTTGRFAPNQQDGKVNGVRVFGVRDGGALSKLGLVNGDVVRTVAGETVGITDGNRRAREAARGTKTIPVVVSRQGKDVTLTLRRK